MSEKDKALSWEDIEREVKSEIGRAEKHLDDNIRTDRTQRWDRYYGRPLGNERKGRSKFISRDTMETIEWLLPELIRTFFSGDSKIELEIEGKPGWVGKALMKKIQDDLSNDEENSLFKMGYQWVKDALVSNMAYVKPFYEIDYEKKHHSFPQISRQQMEQLLSDADIEVLSATAADISPFETGFIDVKVKVKSFRKNKLSAENVPHWEFLYVPEARSMNDEHGKGQKTKVTLDYLRRIDRAYSEGKEHFFKLDKVSAGKPSSSSATLENNEEQSFRSRTIESEEDGGGKQGAAALGDFIEWFTRLDVDGDGYMEDITAWVFNNVLIRWEKNEEGFVPFSGITAIIDPYKFEGISFAELLIEIQNLKTMLFRRVLDNFDFTNSGRWIVGENANVDVRALLNNIPGDVIRGNHDKIKNVPPEPFHPSVFTLFEYIDSIKENRSGSTRYNQGMDGDSLNKTASGIAMIRGAAQKRIELVARIIAETGLVDFYRKCARLLQLYSKKPFLAKVKGKEIRVTPEMIQGKIKAKVNMGIEAEAGFIEAQKIERMFAFLAGINKLFPGLISHEQVHNLATLYVNSLGFKQNEDFINALERLVQQAKNGAKIQQQRLQQALKLEQADRQLKMMELKIKAKKIEDEVSARMTKIQSDWEIDMASLAQRDRENRRENAAKMLGI